MGSRFTREQFEQRLDALYAFAREQGYQITALGHEKGGRHFYLVQHAENCVEVTLTDRGRVSVSPEQGMGSGGRISPRLLAWLKREGLHCQYDSAFSDTARRFLSGDRTHGAFYAPQVSRPEVQVSAGDEMPRIRQLLPAQPGWFAVYAKAPGHGKEKGFEMHPIIGWALLDEGTGMGAEYVPRIAALIVWSVLDTLGRGSAPGAAPYLVAGERSGFLGFAFPGCSVEWEKLGIVHQKLLKPLLFPVATEAGVDWEQMAEEHRRLNWDEERACWKE